MAPEDAILGFDIAARATFGENMTEAVAERQIKCQWVKLLD